MSETPSVVGLKAAEPPGKQNMLALLDEPRVRVEAGATIALLVTEVATAGRFSTHTIGDLKPSDAIGLLTCHVDDLVRHMRDD